MELSQTEIFNRLPLSAKQKQDMFEILISQHMAKTNQLYSSQTPSELNDHQLAEGQQCCPAVEAPINQSQTETHAT